MAPRTDKESLDSEKGSVRGSSRRGFLKGGAGLVAGAAGARLLASPAAAQQPQNAAGTLQSLMNSNGRAILLKDGIVLSMDPKVGAVSYTHLTLPTICSV